MKRPPLRIRRGMDVYSAYQNQYLGTVIEVQVAADGVPSAVERGSTPQQTQSHDAAAHPGSTAHVEQDTKVATHDVPAKRILGEDLGPFPTGSAGNTGPHRQAAGQYYATTPRDQAPGIVTFVVGPAGIARLNPFARKLYVPTSAVQNISMERIILDVQREQIPAAWYIEPVEL